MAVNPSSLIQIPLNIEDPVVLRRFLAALIENLDVALGYRQSDSSVSISELNYAPLSISAAYTQAEMQSLADRVDAIASTLDNLITALKANKQVT